jgi:hypothetical protein
MLDLIEKGIITDLLIYIREADELYKKEVTDSTFSQQDCNSILKRYVLEELLFFPIGVKQFDFLLFQARSVFAFIFHTGTFSPYTIPAYHRSTIFVRRKSFQLAGYMVMHYMAKYAAKPLQPTYRTAYTTDYGKFKQIDF